MKTKIFIFLFLSLQILNAQVCDNLCLDLNGINDFVSLPSSPVDGSFDFTIELWFTSNNNSVSCSGPSDNRVLYSFYDSSHYLTVYECNGNLVLVYKDNSTIYPAQILYLTNVRTGGIGIDHWHHLAMSFGGGNIVFLLNGSNVSASYPVSSSFNFSDFTLGDEPNLGFEDWSGRVDDVRVWQAIKSPTDIDSENNCALAGTESNLIWNWTFDDGIAGGNNTSLTQVGDTGPIGHHGSHNNLTLTGNSSNYINSNAGLVYPNYHGLSSEIRDYPYKLNLLTEICDGDPAHFCLQKNGNTVPIANNITVQWMHSDDGGTTWINDPSVPFQDYCFAVPTGNLTVGCGSSTTGFVDRKYRAMSHIVDSSIGESCDYLSEEYDIRICCPIGPFSVSASPNTALCENETITFAVNLNPSDLFLQTPSGPTSINWWYIDPSGPIPLPAYVNQLNFTHTVSTPNLPTGTGPVQICFEAEINHCSKNKRESVCITVDPEPVCGDIIGLTTPNTLTLVTTFPHQTYEICPGNDAALGIDPLAQFEDCIPEWQYSFGGGVWASMGYSNLKQNTNILPTVQPPVPWPTSTTSIFYRIKCNPLSSPSGCEPCYSDSIEIRLTPDISAININGPAVGCIENAPYTLTVSNVVAGLSYSWHRDGLPVGTGTSYMANQSGCYQVHVSNGCEIFYSPMHCIELCKVIALISCPLNPNECADPDSNISVSACDSYITCNNNNTPLQYSWTVNGAPQSTTNCQINISPTGTNPIVIGLVVTDPFHGCVGTAQRTIIPCDL